MRTSDTDSNEPRRARRGLAGALCASAAALVVASSVGCGTPPADQSGDLTATTSAVIGGTTTVAGAIPWMAHIYFNGEHKCGGSLVAPNWILTANHCTLDGSGNPLSLAGLSVILGDYDTTITESFEQSRTVAEVQHNPSYGDPSGNLVPHADFAVIRLASPVTYTANVSPVRPAIGGDTSGTADITGWGATVGGNDMDHQSSPTLLRATLPIQPMPNCGPPQLPRSLYTDEICAGDSDGNPGSCHGDSGSPLVALRPSGRYEQVGIASWGELVCLGYQVFSRVSLGHDWIRHYVVDPAQIGSKSALLMM